MVKNNQTISTVALVQYWLEITTCEVECMKVGEAVSIRMKAILETQNKAVYRLTREIAMPYDTMKSIMYGKTDGVNLKNVLLIIRGLGITAAEFFDDPIFEDPELEID